jgi:hypothetical protein
MELKDICGQRFGKLVVIEYAEWMRYFGASNQYFYILERKNGVEGAFSILYARNNSRITAAL